MAAAAAVVIVLGGVVALLFWSRTTDRVSDSTADVLRSPSTLQPPADVARGNRTPETVPASGTVGSDSAVPATKDAPTEDSSRLAEELQAAIESSLSGVLDVEALLDSTLSLTNLQMQPGPAGADDKVTQELRLLNPPPGVASAEVWIGPASGPNGTQALSLRVTLKPQVRPYVVAGATRLRPEIDLTVVTDSSGALLEHRILTHLGAAPSDGPASDVVEGVVCLFDATGTGKNSMKFLGTKGGKPVQWDAPMALSGADPTEKWKELGRSLAARLQQTKKQ